MSVRTGVCAMLLGILAAVLGASSAAVAAPAVSGEFPLSSEIEASNKIVEGPDGNMWATLSGPTNDVARITPAGEVTEYDLEVTGASGITAGPDGSLWVTYNGGVTKFAPADPVGTKAATAIVQITGNHSIVTGPDGNLWVATNGKLIRIPPSDPTKASEFDVAELSPRDIDVAGPLLAISDFNNRVVTATTADPPAITDYKLNGGSQGVAGAPSGQIAFSQQATPPTEFGLLTPPGPPLLTESPGTDPFGVAFGNDGAFWIAQFAKDAVTRLGTDDVATTLTGFAAGSGPRQIAPGPGNTLWVTLQNSKQIGRISGVEPAVEPIAAAVPRTQIRKGPRRKVTTRRKRATVRFRFRSPDVGASFECRLRRLAWKRATASKLVRFRPCRSPKTYRLRPGRYRFQVRAVLAGVIDPSPAKRTFRVVRVAKRR